MLPIPMELSKQQEAKVIISQPMTAIWWKDRRNDQASRKKKNGKIVQEWIQQL